MGTALWAQATVLLAIITLCNAQNLFVLAPNTLRMGAEETVAIFSHTGEYDVRVHLTDFPGRKKQFSISPVKVNLNEPALFKVKVNPEDIPDLKIKAKHEKHYVLLVASAKGFQKEIKILVTPNSGYVFLQTDKPIYTPVQPVNVRILTLDEDMTMANQTFTLQIRNPQNIVVENIEFPQNKGVQLQSGIHSYVFKFPKFPPKGIWSAVVFHGQTIKQNYTVTFEVDEYILPTFEVKVTSPQYILPTDQTITVSVDATYVYGRKVDGYVSYKFGFKPDLLEEVIHFANLDNVELKNGHATSTFDTNEMKVNGKVGWFPKVLGGKLVVEATVREQATGDKETTTDSFPVD